MRNPSASTRTSAWRCELDTARPCESVYDTQLYLTCLEQRQNATRVHAISSPTWPGTYDLRGGQDRAFQKSGTESVATRDRVWGSLALSDGSARQLRRSRGQPPMLLARLLRTNAARNLANTRLWPESLRLMPNIACDLCGRRHGTFQKSWHRSDSEAARDHVWGSLALSDCSARRMPVSPRAAIECLRAFFGTYM